MWGIIPAAGAGSRMQPLAFSKELLPVGSRAADSGEQPRAVSEYIIERMAIAGAAKICIVIAPDKLDILEYHGAGAGAADFFYAVQPKPAGLCDAIFRAAALIDEREPVIVGLPDTVWFPEDALKALPDDELSFLLFPVEHPERFDAVVTDEQDAVRQIQVKQATAATHRIWGAFKMPGSVFAALHRLWQCGRNRSDAYIGTLVNAYLDAGGRARGVRAGSAYFDVGTLGGYREAIRLLSARADDTRRSAPEAAR
jgi:dTDP-glucose pyrophosphorylase